ncbi:hypothetical protein [Aquipuribacter sp. SD81]|uniref:hypothetical protein n=1 Tax=Aquipuribacter sp. SD81 TaxID=3127703 RepID=UPI0030162BF0
MLPGPFRPLVRFDPHRRRRVRRTWSRLAPVAVPVAVLCLLLGPLLARGTAPDASPGAPDAPGDGVAGSGLSPLPAAGGPGSGGLWDARVTDGVLAAEAAASGAATTGAAPEAAGLVGHRSVLVAVAPVEPGLLPLLRPGDRVDVYGPAPPDDRPRDAPGDRAALDAPAGWVQAGTAPVVRLVEAALVVAVPVPVDGTAGASGTSGAATVPTGTVAVAVSDADARVLASARPGGLDLALRPRGPGP